MKLNHKKMEAAADRFVSLGTELGLSREEMASVCIALAANHLASTGVSEERAGLAMISVHRLRKGRGVDPRLLVSRVASEEK